MPAAPSATNTAAASLIRLMPARLIGTFRASSLTIPIRDLASLND